MTRKRVRKQNVLAEALGASRVLQLGPRRMGGPLDWLQLVQMVKSRLISRGGRPSDPRWDTKRLVPFRRMTWKRLSREAEIISTVGRRVGPAQLAAIVIERGLGDDVPSGEAVSFSLQSSSAGLGVGSSRIMPDMQNVVSYSGMANLGVGE